MQIIPANAPIIAPKTRSVKKFKFMTKLPSKMEKTIKASIVNKTPIIAPQR